VKDTAIQDIKEKDQSAWTTLQHISDSTRKDDTKAFEIKYRLCRCKDCILSSEQMTVIRICELLVHALASMVNAQSGLEFLKDTYEGDEGTIAHIQGCQMDLKHITTQYVKLVVCDDDKTPMIQFVRPYISKTATDDALP